MKFRKKPIVIEAIQLNHENLKKIWEWMGDAYDGHETFNDQHTLTLKIKTFEGTMEAGHNDWIIKGIKNEFYPCKPDIFEATYEAIE